MNVSILTGLFNCPWYLAKHFISSVGLVYSDTNVHVRGMMERHQ